MDRLQDAEKLIMDNATWNETFVGQTVTYILKQDGNIVLIEHVPARVCVETGEQLFAPEVVERLQRIVREKKSPSRVIDTPVFEYA